jgi:hypothetical protein
MPGPRDGDDIGESEAVMLPVAPSENTRLVVYDGASDFSAGAENLKTILKRAEI